MKYNYAGVQQWVAGNDTADTPSDVEVDALENVYVTGSSETDGRINRDVVIVKYDNAGWYIKKRVYFH